MSKASTTDDGAQSGAPAAAPVALNLAPVKNTPLDLFAKAPEAKKLTRKEKQKLAIAAQTSSADGKPVKGILKNKSPLFEVSYSTPDLEQQVAAQEAAKNRGRKSKKQVLRHALHPNEEEDTRTVFVGNLPNTAQRREVERVFKHCGAIESVRLRCQVLESTDKDEKRGRAVRVLRGEVKKDTKYTATAYVLFKSAASIPAALEVNGTVFRDHHLVVTRMGVEDKAYPPETSVFLGNVSYDTTEEEVWNFFVERGIPDVRRVRLVRDRDTGACKGFGYVEFAKRASVNAALALRDTKAAELNGRVIRMVHVNKAKDVKATTVSRREKRREQHQQQLSGGKNHAGAGDGSRAGQKRGRQSQDNGAAGPSKRQRREDGTTAPSWMGVMTNPRKKMPRDLRDLVPDPEGARRRRATSNTVVKHKTRNPNKHDE